MTIMTIKRIRRIHACLCAMPRRLYCPDCGSYLEGGDGELKDCLCGWKQPVKPGVGD